jgi:hypothetical protein
LSYLRSVIGVTAHVIFVSWGERDKTLTVELESPAREHLQIQLTKVSEVRMPWEDIAYLIIVIELLIIALSYQVPNRLIGKANPIIEVSQPYNSVMILNKSIPLKAKSLANSFVVIVPFIIIRKASS